MYIIEGPKNGFNNIAESIYWAIITLTTVGYGNLVPETVLGKMLAAFIMILGYAVIAVPTGIVSSEFAKNKKERKAKKKRDTILEKEDKITLSELLNKTNWTEAVIKPAISGAARHTYRITPNTFFRTRKNISTYKHHNFLE